ncbi:hypothetical protein CS0771_02160 [Catellatospora sp. IY07-71]|uniref:hypothetical protein n=1 Tax=Catellatospora sp. IY07-71 TaxID=2728827 RepID=UPI001BB397AD|nr:hypothetical protein [Catellatospora sp. IY07-71]BCJ70672.1 hypothetical protein CS0771_02160 [Catellatospora sp. IY07-71]
MTTVKSQAHAALAKLRAALPMFAEQAGQYADAEAAVVRARRSRARRIAVGAALAVLPLALVGVLFAVRGGDTVPPPLTGTASPSPSVSAPAQVPPMPTQVPEPGPDVAALPRDRGVGPASLLRYDLTSEPGKVRADVLAGGSWYRTTFPNIRSGNPAELSPDGRWLLWPTPDGAVVRDLAGTAERVLPGALVVRWSPTGNWLLGYRGMSDRYSLYSVPDWTEFPAPAREAGWSISGVLDTGEVLRMADTGKGGKVGVEVVDPRTGAVRPLAVDISGSLRPAEGVRRRVVPLAAIHPTADGTAAIEVREESPAGSIVAFVQISVTDGRVVRRHDVPPAATPMSPNFLICYRGTELFWRGDDTINRRQGPDGAVTTVGLPPGRYRLPGCWSVF